MALPSTVINVTYRDGRGISSTATHYFDDNADVQGTAQLIAQGADALSDAVITGLSFVTNVPLPAGLKLVAQPDSNVEHRATFTFNNENGKAFQVSVPAIKDSAIIDGTDRVSSTAPGYVNFLNGALSAGDGTAVDSNNILLIDLRNALENFTAKRKSPN